MILKRYHDENSLITDINELQLSNTAEVLIYREDQWCCDVTFDLEGKKEKFEELKPVIAFAARSLSEMDCIAQKYSSLCGDDRFAEGYVVAYVCFYEPDKFQLTYYGTCENTEFDVVFQYVDDDQPDLHIYSTSNADHHGHLVLKSFGMVKDICSALLCR